MSLWALPAWPPGNLACAVAEASILLERFNSNCPESSSVSFYSAAGGRGGGVGGVGGQGARVRRRGCQSIYYVSMTRDGCCFGVINYNSHTL